MTFADELDLLGQALARLATTGTDVLNARDIDIALSGRRAVTDLQITVHQELTSMRSAGPPTLQTAATHPVMALGQALRTYPAPPGAIGPLDVFAIPSTSAPGRAWQDVARYATLARHSWSSGKPSASRRDQLRPTQASAWTP